MIQAFTDNLGQTIIVTAAAQAASVSAAAAKSSGTNTAGIAAGVVVGVIAAAALAGGVFLWLRNKRRREVEEEYRRNAAVNNFVGQPPTSSAGQSAMTDTRLDATAMAHNRLSTGSIADNQDYSRRILKVRSNITCLSTISILTWRAGHKCISGDMTNDFPRA